MKRSLRPALLGLSLWAMAPMAGAQDEVCAPIERDAFLERLAEVEVALAEFRLHDARYYLQVLNSDMRCLTTPILPTDLVHYARVQGLMSFFDQDEVFASRWLFLAQTTVPEMPWPVEMGPMHPIRDVIEGADEPAFVLRDGFGLAVPKGGGVFINGHLWYEPKVRDDMPNFVQIFDKKGLPVESYWLDGAKFRDSLLVDLGGKPLKQPSAPKWYVPQDLEAAVAAAREDPAFTTEEAPADDFEDEFMDDDFDIDFDEPMDDFEDADLAPPPPPVDTNPPPEGSDEPPAEPVEGTVAVEGGGDADGGDGGAEATPGEEQAPVEEPPSEQTPEQAPVPPEQPPVPPEQATVPEPPAPDEPPGADEVPAPEEPAAPESPSDAG